MKTKKERFLVSLKRRVGLIGTGLLMSQMAGAAPDFFKITRGPYLQSGSSQSVVVRWRTALPGDTQVRFGPTPSQLYAVFSDSGRTTEHRMRITGLDPATRYYYSIGSSRA